MFKVVYKEPRCGPLKELNSRTAEAAFTRANYLWEKMGCVVAVKVVETRPNWKRPKTLLSLPDYKGDLVPRARRKKGGSKA